MRLIAFTGLVVASVGLAGCLTTNQVSKGDGPSVLRQGNGIVVMGHKKDEAYRFVSFGLDIRPIDIATGQIDDAIRGGAFRHTVNAWFNAKGGFLDEAIQPTPDRLAYNLPPGDYIIRRISTSAQGGILGALHSGAYDPTLQQNRSSYDPRNPKVTRPIFTLRSGEVLYIGDLDVRLKGRIVERKETSDESLPVAGETKIVREVVDRRMDLRMVSRENEARAFAQSLGLSSWPFRVEIVNLYPPVQQSRTTPQQPAPQNKIDRPMITNSELRHRFLAGEIAMEQYNAARARQ